MLLEVTVSVSYNWGAFKMHFFLVNNLQDIKATPKYILTAQEYHDPLVFNINCYGAEVETEMQMSIDQSKYLQEKTIKKHKEKEGTSNVRDHILLLLFLLHLFHHHLYPRIHHHDPLRRRVRHIRHARGHSHHDLCFGPGCEGEAANEMKVTFKAYLGAFGGFEFGKFFGNSQTNKEVLLNNLKDQINNSG